MHNITVLLHKEWLEFKQQRALLLSIIFVPLLLTLIPLVALYAIGHTPSKGNTDEFTELVARANPALAGHEPGRAGPGDHGPGVLEHVPAAAHAAA